MEADLKSEQLALLQKQIEVMQRELAAAQQEIDFQKRLTEIAQKETEVYKLAFEKEKELTDRAIKLAEISKPKSDWQFQGLAAAAILLVGILIGK